MAAEDWIMGNEWPPDEEYEAAWDGEKHMPTGTGRGGRGGDFGDPFDQPSGGGRGGRGGGDRQTNNDGTYTENGVTYDQNDQPIRVKVGVAWINGDKAGPYLGDMLADGVYLRFSLDDFEGIPQGWNIFGFPNKNKKGKAPDIDFVALPPKQGGGGRGRGRG
jgi:hypothetical protein